MSDEPRFECCKQLFWEGHAAKCTQGLPAWTRAVRTEPSFDIKPLNLPNGMTLEDYMDHMDREMARALGIDVVEMVRQRDTLFESLKEKPVSDRPGYKVGKNSRTCCASLQYQPHAPSCSVILDAKAALADALERVNKMSHPIQRVLDLCDTWDALSKGESGTTAAIRAAIAGEAPEVILHTPAVSEEDMEGILEKLKDRSVVVLPNERKTHAEQVALDLILTDNLMPDDSETLHPAYYTVDAQDIPRLVKTVLELSAHHASTN